MPSATVKCAVARSNAFVADGTCALPAANCCASSAAASSKPVGVGEPVHQSEGMARFPGNRVAQHQHFAGHSQRDESGEPLSAAGARQHAEFGFRQA